MGDSLSGLVVTTLWGIGPPVNSGVGAAAVRSYVVGIRVAALNC